MSKFEFMQDTVDAICYSMKNEPESWSIGVYDVCHKNSSAEYKKGSFTEIWRGGSWVTIFSYEQGQQIKKSFKILEEKRSSEAQNLVIKAFKPVVKKVETIEVDKEVTVKGKAWWRFWE